MAGLLETLLWAHRGQALPLVSPASCIREISTGHQALEVQGITHCPGTALQLANGQKHTRPGRALLLGHAWRGPGKRPRAGPLGGALRQQLSQPAHQHCSIFITSKARLTNTNLFLPGLSVPIGP